MDVPHAEVVVEHSIFVRASLEFVHEVVDLDEMTRLRAGQIVWLAMMPEYHRCVISGLLLEELQGNENASLGMQGLLFDGHLDESREFIYK